MSNSEKAPGLTSHMPLLLAILIGASIWIYTFTSWFPIFGSILGFGGVLMVVPALQGLMSDGRRKAYSTWVDQILFQNRSSARLYVVLLIVGLTAGFLCVQPLRMTNHFQDRSLEVQIGFSQFATDKPPTRRIRISAGDTHSTPLLQPFLGGPTFVWISSPGLPQIRKKVEGFGWPAMDLPEDLWLQPIVLLRPAPSLLLTLEDSLPQFEVTLLSDGKVIGKCIIQQKYVGEPVWVGGGRNTFTISDSQLNRWLREFRLAFLRGEIEGESERILTTTLRPRCTESAKTFEHLKVGNNLKWRLSSRNTDKIFSEGQIEIKEDSEYPLEIKMEPLPEEDL